MSFEYVASTVLTEDEAALLRARLPDARYLLVGDPDARRLSLRYSNHAEGREWAEDISIHLGAAIVLAIHSGDESERVAFLEHLESVLRRMGHPCRFEED